MKLSGKLMRDVLRKGKVTEVFPGLVLKDLNEKYLPRIHELIASSYTESPYRTIFKVSEEDNGDDDVKSAEKFLKSNASWGVFVKQTDELVALRMSTIHNKADGAPSHEITDDTNPRVAVRLRFLNYLVGDLFADLNTECYMRGAYSCTSPQYRSRGLASAFERVATEVGRSRGCEYFVGILASHYLQKVVQRTDLGYTVLKEVRFADYIDPETGLKPDLDLSPIHTSVQVVYRKFPKDL